MSDEKTNQVDCCAECGAPTVDGLSCYEMFCTVLAWEADDAELQAEHFKTVATYNLQHPSQFTDEALEGLRKVFIEHIDNNLPISEIRKRVGKVAEGNNRVRKDKAERQLVGRNWAVTVADVYDENNPVGAVERVRRWAAAVRKEL